MIVDSGNLFCPNLNVSPQETPLAQVKSKFMIKAMNTLGYDAVNISYNDFCLGLETFQQREAEAEFPFISANILYKESKNTLAKPYLIKKVGNLNIGILGLVNDTFPKEISKNKLLSLSFNDPIETTRKYIPELKEKCDLIIALTYLGFQLDERLAKEFPEINIIVGGLDKSRFNTPKYINNTLILQSGQKGMYIGQLDLIIRGKAKKFLDSIQQKRIEATLNNLSKQIGQLTFSLAGEKAEVLLSKSPEAKRLKELKAQKEQIKNQLKEFETENIYENRLIPLDKRLADDPAIKTLLISYNQELKEKNISEKVETAKINEGLKKQVVVLDSIWNVGLVNENQILNKIIRIKNLSDKKLTITKTRPACSCISATILKAGAVQNEMAEIKAEITIEGLEENFSRDIYIETDNPQERVVVVKVIGRLLPSKPPEHILEISLFYSEGCGECREIKDVFLPKIKQKYGSKITVKKYNIADIKNYERLIELENKYKVTENSPVEIFVADTYLVGRKKIIDNLEQIIQQTLKETGKKKL